MSILDARKSGLEALYADLQREAARRAVPGCTIDQVRQVMHSLGRRRYNRSEMALCLYWQVMERHLDEWPCQEFLAQLRQLLSEEEPDDSSYYGSYALNHLLKYSPLLQILGRRKQTPAAKKP